MKVSLNEIKTIINKLSDIIIANEIPFCELDSAAGDGDFGMSVAKGFKEIKKQWNDIEGDDIYSFLKNCSMIITEHCGGASGPIWGSAFRAAALSAKGKDGLNIDDIASMFEAAVSGIQKRGGAKLGDKTLLDALIPSTEALRQAADQGLDYKAAFKNASAAATVGAENTKSITATKGRASYVGERSLSYPDAGAMAVSVILNEFIN
jgi:dihydroxyacetone kinase